MLLYKKSYTNNLSQQEKKYATREFYGIYFLEAIIKIRRGKKTKSNKTKPKKSHHLA